MIETTNANAFSLLNGLFVIETDFVASRGYESETNKTMTREHSWYKPKKDSEK